MILALMIGACNGGGDDDAMPPAAAEGAAADAVDGADESGTEADLERAVRATFTAFRDADDNAWYERLSRVCQEALGFSAVEAHLDARRFNIDLGDIDLGGLEPGSVSVERFDGASAVVSLTIEGTSEAFQENLPHPWLFEDGSWRMDDCSAISPPANDLTAEGVSPDDPIEFGFIADLEGWLMTLSWINLDDESTVIELGGTPAPDGHRLVTANVSLTYNGTEQSVSYGATLAFDVRLGDREFDQSCETPAYGTAENANVVLAPGDSTRAIVCRVVPTDQLDGLVLRVTHVPTGGERWFSLRQD